MIHGNGTRADGPRFKYFADLGAVEPVACNLGSPSRSPVIWPVPQLKRLKREFILQPPVMGLSVPRRRYPRRTGKSVGVNRTTAFWSIWIVAILAGRGSGLFLGQVASRPRIGTSSVVADAGWMDSTPNKRKETNINLGVVVELFSSPPSAGRRLRFRRLWMKTGLELI